ncbi:type II toxin-antitoxin system RelE/ParE family toxin [Rhizobium sp. PP-CC-3G-465]|uniref:type II toxin-antitoxin system RelE/ParE family toxin n=1 Tax=Rhizobium sp. PP-CC-3G-465 TaxID=2135648 RepID=UPI0010442607|nr:plasmid stabilization system protein ParE [Rhizobium sp. PP-CC-3G-465]
MRYAVTRHPAFEADLREIQRLIEDYAGAGVANRKIVEIVRFIERLSDFPKIGSVRNDIMEGLRAIPATDKATVCFVVDDEAMDILILAVGYAGSDWQARMAERRRPQ